MSVIHDPNLSDFELSNDTLALLSELIKRKDKLERAKFQYTAISLIGVALVVILLWWLFTMNSVGTQDMLAYFTNSMPMFYIVLTAGLIIYTKRLGDQYKKAKEKYEDLRKEAITKLQADWEFNYGSSKTDRLSAWLTGKDINIRYKS